MSPRPSLEPRPFFGRGAELASLRELRRDVSKCRGSVVLVAGPVGIGKSRLLDEFLREARSGRAPLAVRVECLEAGGRAFGPIRAIIEAVAADDREQLDIVAESAQGRGELFDAIEGTLRRVSRKRTLIAIVEDLHWADHATLEFLAHLAPRIAGDRIALIATYRDDEILARPSAVHALGRITRPPSTRLITLAPLDDATVFGMVDALHDGNAALDRSAIRDIVTRAEGNPFFVEELLRASAGGTPKNLPLSISGSVLARWASLSPTDRRVLAHAAVIGYRFDPAMLATILTIRADALARALRNAQAERLIVEERGSATGFRFNHALTHETIAAQMLEYEARPLHAQIASALETSPDAERAVAEIAYHWLAANDPRAVAAAEAAGDAAMALHAYADATTWFERALAITSDSAVQSRLCSRAALAANVQGDQLGSLAFYERALELEVASGHFKEAGELVRRVAGRLVYAGRKDEAIARLRAFLERHEENVSEVDALLITGWPLLIEFGGGGVREWRARFSKSVVEATGRDAWSLLLLELHACASVGDHAAWRDVCERLRTHCENGVPLDRALSMFALGTTATYLGTDLSFARKALAQTHAFCEEQRLSSVRKYVSACEVFERYLAGDVRAAGEAARAALADSDDPNQRENVAIVGGLVGLELDDAELIELARTDGPRAMLRDGIKSHSDALCATSAAVRLLGAGRANEATALLERAVAAVETMHAAQFLLPLAARHVASTRARKRLEALCADVDPNDRAGLATAAMIGAVFAERDDDPNARDLALRAATRYADLGWLILQASALELAGDVHAARELYLKTGCVRQARRLGTRRRDQSIAVNLPGTSLSQREREVALLVTEGLGNVEIASRLSVSIKTVESHLSRIFARFGFRSRAQLAAHMAIVAASDDNRRTASPR